jgi:hypothetical protein
MPIGGQIRNWKSAIGNVLLISSVRQHRHHALMISFRDEHVDVQMALPLGSLFRQYVPRMRMAPLDLPGSRQPHSFGCTFVRFKFWHL